ncbi:Mov34/MPN/PAD-1 family protein (plasmid) [Paraclostridium bifermentans]|uniref:Mov34/MPN/PAD-1 family protein n=1 Tax=Paraclostridium bifermentans TaxID=1490 RepID=A0ABY8R9V7_PARBF|nr:Mov34/MPN/PAD-1 family protein [Paraclostridium bifermentans]
MQHAKEVYPHECAGLVTQKSRVQKYHRLDNVSPDPENESMPDETQYAMAAMDGEPIAFVHSHTGDGQPQFRAPQIYASVMNLACRGLSSPSRKAICESLSRSAAR